MDRIYEEDCLRHYTAQELVDEYFQRALRNEMECYRGRTSYVDFLIPFCMLVSISVMMLFSAWIGSGWALAGGILGTCALVFGGLALQEYFRRKHERSFDNWESKKALAITALSWHFNVLEQKLSSCRVNRLRAIDNMKTFGEATLPCDEYDTLVDSLYKINQIVDDYYRYKFQYVKTFVESDDFKNASPEMAVSLVHADLVVLSELIHGNVDTQKLLKVQQVKQLS